MSFNNIEFVIEDGTAILTFNRPDSLNSFNAEMHAEVREALKEVKKNPGVRALVITGNGRGFCAGQDLSDRNVAPGAEAPNLGESIEKNYNPMIRTIRALEMPVICAVNGVAAGAGANIALACDIVFAAKSAKFIQAFCKIGLIPDSGGTWTLPHTVGQARAMALSMLGDRVTEEDAEKMVMIWKAVYDEAVKETAIATAKEL
ncbi:MAG: enoyl-CoA hydratase-related protein, partial [Oceanospirillum sp.]|nr:enoyl-CoA hydratase-related protein [Oceanospirillum sp.]